VQAFAETRYDEQGLVLLGEVGVGKTTLLLGLVRSLAGRWVAERKVVRLVTSRYPISCGSYSRATMRCSSSRARAIPR
jgi:stage III sporulation protein SpoIIIAA